MKRRSLPLLSVLLTVALPGIGAALAAGSAEPDFAHYQVILDRKVFGEVRVVPTNAAAAATGIPPPGSFIKDLRMCAITEDGTDLRVGIVDVKQNKSYLFRVGETLDEITLVDADFVDESALLRKGAEEYPIFMKGDAPAGAAPGAPGAAPAGAISVSAAATAVAGREPYAERLRKRRESLRERVVEPPKMSDEQLQEHLKRYQMELIRAGGEKGPPLPIELTPEMDAQLVSEGVLPAAQ
jgi:hypothetical protein